MKKFFCCLSCIRQWACLRKFIEILNKKDDNRQFNFNLYKNKSENEFIMIFIFWAEYFLKTDKTAYGRNTRYARMIMQNPTPFYFQFISIIWNLFSINSLFWIEWTGPYVSKIVCSPFFKRSINIRSIIQLDDNKANETN